MKRATNATSECILQTILDGLMPLFDIEISLKSQISAAEPWHTLGTVWLVVSIYLSTLLVVRLSDAPRRWLVVMDDSSRYRTKLLRAPPGSLTLLVYRTVTGDLCLMSHPKDYS